MLDEERFERSDLFRTSQCKLHLLQQFSSPRLFSRCENWQGRRGGMGNNNRQVYEKLEELGKN